VLQRAHVGAVDGQAGDRFPHRLGQLVARVVAVLAVGLANVDEGLHQPVDVGAEDLAQDAPLGLVDQLRVFVVQAREALIGAGERPLASRVDVETQNPVHELVAGAAGHRPGLGQLLAGGQDLLDHHPGPARAIVQAPQVLLGVAQAVRVVDAHAVEHS